MTEQRATAIEPVRFQVTVRCGAERAFEAFTAEMGRWWPTEIHAIEPGRVADVVVDGRVGGTIRERLHDGTEHEWAVVTAWDPPRQLGLSWHPSLTPTVSTDIEILFLERGDGTTVVEVTHTGWERLGADGPAVRDSYVTGWELVIGRYVGYPGAG